MSLGRGLLKLFQCPYSGQDFQRVDIHAKINIYNKHKESGNKHRGSNELEQALNGKFKASKK